MSILDRPALEFVGPAERQDWVAEEWCYPASEAERLSELEGFLAQDFHTFPEVRIECQFLLNVPMSCRIDLLAVPKAGLDEIVLAFEVKREGFDLERALKQSADYVGGRVCEGPHKGKRIAACFLYPTTGFQRVGSDWRWPEAQRQAAMFNLIAQWRVGRSFVDPFWHELTLALGYVVIWRSKRGWVASKANDMLLGKRSAGGSRRLIPQVMAQEEEEERQWRE
jgi:hypothetical protein